MRWVALHHLLIQEGEPPMDWQHVRDLVSGAATDGRPIDVEPAPGRPGTWRIRNGRHRYCAAMVLGKSHIRCTVRIPQTDDP